MVTFMLCTFCHNKKQQNKEFKTWKDDLEEYTQYGKSWMIL